MAGFEFRFQKTLFGDRGDSHGRWVLATCTEAGSARKLEIRQSEEASEAWKICDNYKTATTIQEARSKIQAKNALSRQLLLVESSDISTNRVEISPATFWALRGVMWEELAELESLMSRNWDDITVQLRASS